MLIESEKNLERKLVKEVESLGGWCIKFVCLHIIGLPDRICLLPEGVLVFVEVKTTKKKPRKIQLKVHQKLTNLGFRVEVVDSSEGIKNLFANRILKKD